MSNHFFLHSILFALLVLVTGAMAQPRKEGGSTAGKATVASRFDRERFGIPFSRFVLKNGLTLIVHEDHSAPIVSVNFWYHVGSRNETRGKTGFAHLFEHFFFNGSENYPHGFREAMDDLGARNRNGTTNSDRTNFFEDVPVPALERTLYLEADRMGFLGGRISKEMLERERGVVKNEKRQGENEPYGRVFNEINSVFYPYSHPYSWSVIGSMEDLDAASLDDIREWYRTYYGPNNAVLVLAGDITPERALELVEKYFGSIPPGPPLPRMVEWVPRLEQDIRMEMVDRVPQTRIYRIYHAPSWLHHDIQHLALFTNVLAGTRSARLNRALVFDRQLVTGVSAFVSDDEITGSVGIIATLAKNADPVVVERAIDSIVADLVDKGPTATELARARSRVLGDRVRGAERLGRRAAILAESMTYGGRPDYHLDQLETMMTATPADIRAASQRWLRAHHLTMVVRPMPPLAAARSTLDRSILPPLGPAPEVVFPRIQRATLGNGLKVLLLERHSTPLVSVALVVDAGNASDQPAGSGAASLATELLTSGTTSRDAYRISDDLDALGARISTSSQLDMTIVRLRALPMNLEASLDLMADVALRPAYSGSTVTLGKQQRREQIAQEKAQPGQAASRLLPSLLFGARHPYGTPGSGTDSAIADLEPKDLADWHSRWFTPDNATLVVTGDVTLEKLLPALERTYGRWKGRLERPKPTAVAMAPQGGKVYLIDRPGSSQSTIVAAHLTDPRGSSDDLAIQMVMRNFGGIATSRLNRNLRLDKHWSYGTAGWISEARLQRTFTIVAPVQTDRTKESMVEIAREIREIAGERPIAGEEFASIMRNSTLQLPGRFETLDALESAAIEQISYGLPDGYWQSYARNVRALTESDLSTAARKLIRPNDLIWIVVGDMKQVEKGIRELGFGEVIVVKGEG